MLPTNLPWWATAAAGAGVALLPWGISSWRRRRREKGTRRTLVLNPKLNDAQTLDEVAARMLQEIATWVKGHAYHAYWLGQDRTSMQLRASLTEQSSPAVAPDYSGLVIEMGSSVALALPVEADLTAPRVRGARDERWLDLPIGPHLLVTILLGPLGRVPSDQVAELTVACQTYAPLTLAIDEWFAARDEAVRTSSLVDSTRIALDVTLRIDRGLELLLNVGSQAVAAAVQIAIVEGPDQPLVVATTPEGEALARQILAGKEPQLMLLPPRADVVPSDRMPALGDQYKACIRMPILLGEHDPVGCFLYFTQQSPTLDTYQIAVLRTLGERAAHLLANQRYMQTAAEGYVETLRVLVTSMDGLSPFSHGHSDRLARIARMIALELNMPEREAEAVALAAYFHDVGMVAVDPRVVLKNDQLTSDEYAQIKRHPELGGQLVASVPAALPLAPMVAGHHERWDGYGYPRGLAGDQIPLGARILAAADAYEAQTTARTYRPAIPYPQAVANLRVAAGSHLDPTIVEALLTALERERMAAAGQLPPAPCWVIKQMPEHICGGCPNRKPQAVRCWEDPANLCSRHGDQCQTCVVYTEAMNRSLGAR